MEYMKFEKMESSKEIRARFYDNDQYSISSNAFIILLTGYFC
jgi:hypothetical protein